MDGSLFTYSQHNVIDQIVQETYMIKVNHTCLFSVWNGGMFLYDYSSKTNEQ